MRALFLLLILANAVFYAYANVVRQGGAVESRIARLQIAPEKIRLLKASGGVPAEKPKASPRPKPAAPAKSAAPVPAACLEWGIFAGPGVVRAESALAGLELPAGRLERAVTDAGGYWVYMPPLKGKVDVDRKIRELRDLGVTEFFVVQDAGPWRNAISLGIFRTDEAAQAFLARLRQRGVRSAIAERRENFLKQVAFYVREPDEATVARLTELQQQFAGSELKAGACPPATATATAAAKG